MKNNLVTLKHNLLSDMLEECQLIKDLVIICSDGQFQCNTLLFVSIFPAMTTLLSTEMFQDDLFVSAPGVFVNDLKKLFTAIHDKKSKILLSPSFSVFFGIDGGYKSDTKIESNVKLESYFSIGDVVKDEAGSDNDDLDLINSYDDSVTFDFPHKEDKIEVPPGPVILNIMKTETRYEDDGDYVFDDNDNEDSDEDYIEKSPTKKVKKSQGNRESPSRTSQGYLTYKFEYEVLYCYVCEKEFKHEKALYTHVFTKHGPSQQCKCEPCDKVFNGPLELMSHKRAAHSTNIPCPECGKAFKTGHLKKHMERVHSEIKVKAEKSVQCNECGQKFSDKYQLTSHIASVHAVCECNIQFTTPNNRLEHMKLVHLGYKKCPSCEKILTANRLENHKCISRKESKRKRLPIRQKNYKRERGGPRVCDICGKTFTSSSGHFIHMKSVHEAEETPCDLCGKVFRSYIHLAEHKKDFHVEPVTCELCGATVKHLARHMRTVHKEDSKKTFQCDFCGKGFNEKRRLERHKMNVHLKLRPYKCRFGCDFGYNDFSNRNAHEKKKHGGRYEELFPDRKEDEAAPRC